MGAMSSPRRRVKPLSPHRDWIVPRRYVAAVLALLYFINSALLAPGGWPTVGDALIAAVTIALWFLPWLWFRSGWLWWPSYLLSTAISVGLVRTIVEAWVMQVLHPGTPLFSWPGRLLYLFLSATVFGLFCVWQTPALFLRRFREWKAARQESRP